MLHPRLCCVCFVFVVDFFVLLLFCCCFVCFSLLFFVCRCFSLFTSWACVFVDTCVLLHTCGLTYVCLHTYSLPRHLFGGGRWRVTSKHLETPRNLPEQIFRGLHNKSYLHRTYLETPQNHPERGAGRRPVLSKHTCVFPHISLPTHTHTCAKCHGQKQTEALLLTSLLLVGVLRKCLPALHQFTLAPMLFELHMRVEELSVPPRGGAGRRPFLPKHTCV